MIELNLLPKELRNKKKKKRRDLDLTMPKIPAVLICICVLSFLIVLHVTLIFFVSNKTNLSNALKSQFDNALTQRKRAEKVNTQVETLQKKLDLVRKIIKPDISWTRLLNGLNQSVLSNMWISEVDVKFSSKQKRTQELPESLNIIGYSIGGSERATSSVAKFMVSLRNNPDFYGYFEEVELDSMKNRSYAGEEVMQFKLECSFKEREMVSFKDNKKNKKSKK